ncbi:MAG: Gfo/Idh/MocA family oxidoreductase [Pirellulales bacterium]
MSHLDRREFLRQAALAGTAAASVGTLGSSITRPARAASRSPNEKLNIGMIGVAAQGAYNLGNVASENIVALCDVDAERLAPVAQTYPKAKTYTDYRKLLDQGDLNAVVIATPDHSHAIAAVGALKRGLDVYCEKPLAHSVYEVRQIRNWTAKQKAVTQMGTQIHAGDNYRRVVELVRAGVLGPIERVHVWLACGVFAGQRVSDSMPPPHVDYDLWIGPAPMRPFHASHFHFNWRFWFDFGGGWLADFGCHYMDLPFWALDLRYPTAVEAKGEKTHSGDNDIPDNMQVDYHFAARGDLPPVHMTWYHGKWRPEGAETYGDGSKVLFEGQRGRLLADYGSHQLFLEPGMEAKTPPATIPSSIGHHAEWIQACKTRGETTCNFDYSGALTETVLLGNVSYRAGGKKLDWNAESLKAVNCPEADEFIRREYRKGWEL